MEKYVKSGIVFALTLALVWGTLALSGAITTPTVAQESGSIVLTDCSDLVINQDGAYGRECILDGRVIFVPSGTTEITITPDEAPANVDVTPVVNLTDTSGNTDQIGESFNPVPDYEQSCPPQELEGCTFDIGAEQGAWSEMLQRFVYRVGIVKGVKIEWDGNVARQFVADNGEARCSIVVIPPNNFLENITAWDANFKTHYVWAGDPEGWMKTLAVQAAYEQHANYGCPERSWPQDFDIWGSNISSPPVGYDDPDNAVVYSTTSEIEPAGDGNSADTSGSVQQQEPSNNGQDTCRNDTVNCLPRKQTSDFGGSLRFSADAAVYGWEITIGGRTYNDCYFANVPGPGVVVDGVVNPWKTEVRNARNCR